jgi:DNA-binding MarR family transcriptional regulator
MVEKDRRRRAVWLTEAGARTLEAAMPRWRAAHEALSRHVDAGMVRQLAEASGALETEREAS